MVEAPCSDLEEGKEIPKASWGDIVSPGCLFLETGPWFLLFSLSPSSLPSFLPSSKY